VPKALQRLFEHDHLAPPELYLNLSPERQNTDASAVVLEESTDVLPTADGRCRIRLALSSLREQQKITLALVIALVVVML
jgi:hypothetical protein